MLKSRSVRGLSRTAQSTATTPAVPAYAVDWSTWSKSDEGRCQESSFHAGNFQTVAAGSEMRIVTMGGGNTRLPKIRIVENETEVGVLVAEFEREIGQLLSLPPECVKVVLEVHSDIASTATVVFMEQTDATYHEADGEVCHVCAQPCEDADHEWAPQTREGNCTRCHPCYLCPQCNIIDERGNPCCFFCLDSGDRDHVEANCHDQLFRIRLLGAELWEEPELPAGWGKKTHAEDKKNEQADRLDVNALD